VKSDLASIYWFFCEKRVILDGEASSFKLFAKEHVAVMPSFIMELGDEYRDG
jgi:hypothetical protein